MCFVCLLFVRYCKLIMPFNVLKHLAFLWSIIISWWSCYWYCSIWTLYIVSFIRKYLKVEDKHWRPRMTSLWNKIIWISIHLDSVFHDVVMYVENLWCIPNVLTCMFLLQGGTSANTTAMQTPKDDDMTTAQPPSPPCWPPQSLPTQPPSTPLQRAILPCNYWFTKIWTKRNIIIPTR